MDRRLHTLCAIGLILAALPGHAGYLGANINANTENGLDGTYAAVNRAERRFAWPLFNQPGKNSPVYWASMVEQYEAAQLDFVAPWLKGGGQPATFANLAVALDERGLAGRVKIVPFDDNPASWTARWNLDHGRGFGYAVPFDLGNEADWAKYIWEANFKVFFQNVPDANRFKIDGRPVIAIWSLAPKFVSNAKGNASRMLRFLRERCRAEFQFDPYIVVPTEWIEIDPTSDDPAVIDAVRPWFTPVIDAPGHSTWNVHTWRGVTIACVVPSFQAPGDYINPDHGRTLETGLKNAVEKSLLTFIEGFDDYWEAATLWRARNIDPATGAAERYEDEFYDYPNQRINIVRKYSNRPFPPDLKCEAEACDSFGGGRPRADAPNFYRNGAISIFPLNGAPGSYAVGQVQKKQWLEWRDVPIQGKGRLQVRVATANSKSSLHFVIDGKALPAVSLPETGGTDHFKTVDAGDHDFPSGAAHTVRIVFDTGDCLLDRWQLAPKR